MEKQEHALVVIEQQAPAAMASTPVALTTGHINYGSDLFKVYVAEETKQSTQVQLLVTIAMAGLTCAEFQAQCKAAQALADETDKATGFTPKADAKGADKYGPKRKVLNQRLSEAKQIFGAMKIAGVELVKEKGYWASLQTARDFLAEKNVYWDGEPIPTDAAKAQAKETKGVTKAMAQAMKDNPQQAGEDMAEYMARLIPIARNCAFEEDVEAAVKQFTEKYGTGDLALTAAQRIVNKISTHEQMHSFAQWLHETALAKGEPA